MGFENGGAGFLEAKTRTFKPLENAQFPELRQITVWSLAQTPNGDIWLGTAANGLYRRRPDGSMQQFLNVPGDSASLPADAVNALRVAPNGTLWIATPGGLVRWDGKQFTRVALPGSSQTVGRLRLERDGNTLWVTDGAGELFRLDAEGVSVPIRGKTCPRTSVSTTSCCAIVVGAIGSIPTPAWRCLRPAPTWSACRSTVSLPTVW